MGLVGAPGWSSDATRGSRGNGLVTSPRHGAHGLSSARIDLGATCSRGFTNESSRGRARPPTGAHCSAETPSFPATAGARLPTRTGRASGAWWNGLRGRVWRPGRERARNAASRRRWLRRCPAIDQRHKRSLALSGLVSGRSPSGLRANLRTRTALECDPDPRAGTADGSSRFRSPALTLSTCTPRLAQARRHGQLRCSTPAARRRREAAAMVDSLRAPSR